MSLSSGSAGVYVCVCVSVYIYGTAATLDGAGNIIKKVAGSSSSQTEIQSRMID